MSHDRPTAEERAAAEAHDPLTCHACLNPDRHGDQAPDALEIENDLLRAQVAFLSQWHYPFHVREAIKQRDLAALRRIAIMSDGFLRGLQEEAGTARALAIELEAARADIRAWKRASSADTPTDLEAAVKEWLTRRTT